MEIPKDLADRKEVAAEGSLPPKAAAAAETTTRRSPILLRSKAEERRSLGKAAAVRTELEAGRRVRIFRSSAAAGSVAARTVGVDAPSGRAVR